MTTVNKIVTFSKTLSHVFFEMFKKNKDTRVHLGRWNLTKCDKIRNNKIDLSNEDHCGTCSQYALSKINEQNKLK